MAIGRSIERAALSLKGKKSVSRIPKVSRDEMQRYRVTWTFPSSKDAENFRDALLKQDIGVALDRNQVSYLQHEFDSLAEQLIDSYLEETPASHKALVKKLSKQKGVRDPEALAAYIGRKKKRKKS